MARATKTTRHVSGDSERGLMTRDTNTPTSSQFRNNMELEEEERVGGEDRIRKLPEPLIHQILSLLPTKCVVSTTVLSKGWKDLWVSVPVLDFREWESPDTQETLSSTKSFMDFVDRVLDLRNMSDIKRFCITCDGEFFDDQRIKAWVTTAIKCRVEELLVCRYCHERVDIFPVDLYTCESLTSLEIEFEKGSLNLPQTISFPRLRILRLTNISFWNEKFALQFFSGSPVLEELCLRYCNWKDLNVISSTLKVLTVVSCSSINKIHAPNLVSIKIAGGMQDYFVVDSFPSLVNVDIHSMYSSPTVPVDFIPNFVKKLSNVKHFKLWGDIFKSLELANVLPTSFPTFGNLITLEVAWMKAKQVRTLFSFLQFSPNLESLVFGRVIFPDEFNEDTLMFDVCLLMHLKSIRFQYFEGKQSELDLVQLFLQNAGILQTVIIDTPSLNSEEEEHTAEYMEDFSNKTMEQLLKYKWASTDCVIKISGSPYSDEIP